MQLELKLGDAHRAQQLALVLVQALDLNIHDAVGIEDEAVVVALDKAGEALLVLLLDGVYLLAHGGVVRVGGELRQLLGLREVVLADELAEQAVQTGVDLREPAAVVDAVGDVGEAVGAQGVDVVEEVVLEDLPVEAGDAVDHIAGGEAEICHVYLTVADDEVAADALIPVEVVNEIVAPAAVDLAHDLPQAGQQLLHQILRPLLERFAHDGVVGVGDALLDDVPGLVPAKAMLVHENAHELGDDHGRVRVVDLDDVVVAEGADVAPHLDVLAHDILRGGGDEEILLLEAQGLALDVVVSGVENLGDDLGHGALLHALDICALGEEVHIERVGTLGVPEAERVDLLSSVARDQHIARQGDDGVIAGVLGVIVAEAVPMRGDLAAEADLDHVLIAGDEPALGGAAPVVGDLGLLAVLEALAENAELIADGIARGLQAEGGHAVHIAGGETTQTAVAEAGVGLGLKNVARAAAQILQRAGEGFADAEVEGVFHEAAAHEEFHGHVVDLFFRAVGILHGQEAAHDLADHDGGRLENLVIGRGGSGSAEVGAELVLNGAAHFVAGNFTDHSGYVPPEELRKRRNGREPPVPHGADGTSAP